MRFRHAIPAELRTGAEEESAVASYYRQFGLKVFTTSVRRKTEADPGIADHIVLCRRRRGTPSAMWWHESKTGAGEQSEAQSKFQAEVEACGQMYVLGGVEAARAHLVAIGILL